MFFPVVVCQIAKSAICKGTIYIIVKSDINIFHKYQILTQLRETKNYLQFTCVKSKVPNLNPYPRNRKLATIP